MQQQSKGNFDFDIMLDKLRRGENFSYARFGDGEWSAILQNRKDGSFNCDGHHFFPDLGKALKEILERRPQYYIGMQNLAKEQNKDDSEFQRLYQINDWSDNEILHRANIRGWMDQFFQELSSQHSDYHKQIVLVGNSSLRSLTQFIVTEFITIADKDCWCDYDSTKQHLMRVIDRTNCLETIPIVLYCASMMSNVLIDDLYSLFGNNLIQIDCGSAFDPYVGRLSRSYMKRLNL